MICPNGHESAADDFCDTCGAKIDPAAQPARPAQPAEPALEEPGSGSGAGQTCPNCQTVNTADALFCEACGYDFTTGVLPRGASVPDATSRSAEPGSEPGSQSGSEPVVEAPTVTSRAVSAGARAVVPGWVAEVWVDPDWYAGQDADEPLPSVGLPQVVPLSARSVLVGRVSTSRNIHPEVDCAGDTGVSRRHAQLTTDGSRWFVEDLESSNGTYVGPASGPLPDRPIAVGMRTELDADDRVYVGAWTRIVVRAATEDELAAQTP